MAIITFVDAGISKLGFVLAYTSKELPINPYAPIQIDTVILSKSIKIKTETSNYNEILAIKTAARLFIQMNPIFEKFYIVSDSQIAVGMTIYWLQQYYTCQQLGNRDGGAMTPRSVKLRRLSYSILDVLGTNRSAVPIISWIPRELNLAGHLLEKKKK